MRDALQTKGSSAPHRRGPYVLCSQSPCAHLPLTGPGQPSSCLLFRYRRQQHVVKVLSPPGLQVAEDVMELTSSGPVTQSPASMTFGSTVGLDLSPAHQATEGQEREGLHSRGLTGGRRGWALAPLPLLPPVRGVNSDIRLCRAVCWDIVTAGGSESRAAGSRAEFQPTLANSVLK